MATLLKQSTAVDVALGPFVDATDGVTPETALTLSQAECRLKKNAGAWGQKNDATGGTHEEEGWYELELDATDTNTLGILILAVYVSGALPCWREFLVVPANVYDSLVADTDKLDASLVQWLGTAPNALVSSRVDVSVGAMAANVIAAAAIASDAIQAAKIQDGALTAAKFAAGAFDAVWSVASRVLTAATNITAAIADQVWDEAIAGHVGAGSTGAALNGATAPSAGAVADAVWDEALSGHLGAGSTGEALNAASSGSAAGPGAIAWDVLVQVGTTPQQAVAVWVSTDVAGANVVAGTLLTPSNGTVSFLLDAGTYYAWARKDGLNPVNAQSFTVS